MNLNYLKLLVLLYFMFDSYSNFCQVIINEVASNNVNWIADEDGDFGDYIELYNAGGQPQDISGWGLTDLPSNKFKWSFPANTIIPNGGFLLVFADDKNRSGLNPNTGNLPSHWETPIKDNDVWEYFPGISSTATAGWNNVGFVASPAWATGMGGFGFGDNDDNTEVSTASKTIYIRKLFNVTNKAEIASAIISLDYDDGVAVYLNGHLIGVKNISGSPITYQTPAEGNHEAKLYLGDTNLEKFEIDYEHIQQYLLNGQNVLAVEAHNVSQNSSDLTIRPFLHLGVIPNTNLYNTANPEWFSAATFIVLPYYYHTNYKISDNENISLFDVNGTPQSNLSSGVTQNGAITCRIPDGSATTCITDTSSPFLTNNNAICYTSYTSKVVMNIPAGSYPISQNISLTCSTPNSSIFYTQNGDFPTINSTLYTSPIIISQTKTIKAICVAPGFLVSMPTTKSYLINEDIHLPILSISCDATAMNEFQTLLYTSELPEVIGHFEYFAPNGGALLYEAGCGVDQHGKGSTNYIPKSMSLSAKSEFGPNLFNYSFFSGKNFTDYNKLIIRSGGNDVEDAHLRDHLCNEVLQKIDFNSQISMPIVVFTNGSYRGVFYLTEGIDEKYVENRTGIIEENLDMIKKDWTSEEYIATNGDRINFDDFTTFMLNNSMAIENNYVTALQKINKKKFLDWYSLNCILINHDWVHTENNIRYFSDKSQTFPKWAPISWDFDLALQYAYYGNYFENIDMLLDKQNSLTAAIFRSFIANPIFKQEFINRTADLLNTSFRVDTLINVKNRIKNQIEFDYTRMLNHYDRSKQVWLYKINEMDDIIRNRPIAIWNKYKSRFSLTDTVKIILETNLANSGTIRINTISPTTYPWDGVYFEGNPIQLQAIPNPGYRFTNWTTVSSITPSINSSGLTNETIAGYVEYPTKFIANFEPTTELRNNLVIDEINYNSGEGFASGDWIELYNSGPNAFNASGYSITNNVVTNKYILPANTILQPNERLVLATNLTSFHTTYRNVDNYASTTLYALGNGGDNLKINLPNNTIFKNVNYDDATPWPTSPDGNGATLQLIKNATALNLHQNWHASCAGGSPGEPYVQPTTSFAVPSIEVYNTEQGLLVSTGCETGIVNWFNNIADGPIFGTGQNINVPAITSPATYYASCITPICSQNIRTPVIVSMKVCPEGAGIWSVKSGMWNDPTVWSCFRIPLPNDFIKISLNNLINLESGQYKIKNIELEGSINLEDGAEIIFE